MLESLQRWFASFAEADSVVVPDALWTRVEADLPCLRYLPRHALTHLRELATQFLARKEFHGAHGMVLSDEIMLAIALQACLPILRTGIDSYDHWVGIVVYPGDFLVDHEVPDENGIVHSGARPLLGEAWDGGPVIVSWHAGGLSGANVMIHEFAHTLDMANGAADGFPPLLSDMNRADWASAFSAAYDDLCARIDANRPTALDPYAGEHPAEFFAVASEAFFETPLTLHSAYPAVYAQLAQLFGVDPAARADAPRQP